MHLYASYVYYAVYISSSSSSDERWVSLGWLVRPETQVKQKQEKKNKNTKPKIAERVVVNSSSLYENERVTFANGFSVQDDALT